MRKTQRIHALILLLCLLVGLLLTGCEQTRTTKTTEPQIVVTGYIEYDLVRHVLGNTENLTMLQKIGMESHSYEPTPQDLIAITNCDLFVYGGGESDRYIDSMLAASDRQPQVVFSLLSEVEALPEEEAEGMQTVGRGEHHHAGEEEHHHADEKADHDHAEDAEKNHHAEEEEEEYDEHVWTSPKNACLLLEKLCAQLCAICPQNAADYEKNTESYLNELKELDEAYTALAQNAERHTLLFGDRFPFLYLCRAYGWDYYAAFPGCAEQTEPSAATLRFLIDKIQAEKIPCVCQCAYATNRIAQVLCEETGAELITLNPGHTVSPEEMERNVSYADLLRENLASLSKALAE